MNKQELIKEVQAKCPAADQKAVKAAIETVFPVITEALEAGEPVDIHGFGKFETGKREERKGRNPQTGAEITIPASKVPKFKYYKAVKDAVAK